MSRLRTRQWYAPLVALTAGALALRLVTMALYSSSVLTYYGGDSARYLRLPFTNYVGLFDDPAAPAGYPAFLRAMREIWSALPFTIGVQHLLGVVAALLLYLAARRAGAGKAASLLPAGIVLYSGDQLFLEHALLAEALWTPLLAAGLYAAVRAVDDEGGRGWALASSAVLFGLAAIVRHLALLLPALTALWALLALPGGWRDRTRMALSALLPAVVLVGGYTALARVDGGYTGFTELAGFNLYGRVGQFADCRRFDPPPGTEVLCEDTPPGQRGGTFFYRFDPASPMYPHFPATADGSKALGPFARAAVVHQPIDYARTVAKDTVRYLAPDVGFQRPGAGATPQDMSFGRTIGAHQSQTPQELAAQYDSVYSGVRAEPAAGWVRTVLGAYQSVFRVGGLALVMLVLLAANAVMSGSPTVRRAAVLCVLLAGYLFVAPPAVSSYDVRYGVPPTELLAVAAALGLRRWRPRLRRHSARTAVPAS